MPVFNYLSVGDKSLSNLSRFEALISFSYFKADGRTEYDVDLTLACLADASDRLQLKFLNVKDLKIDRFGGNAVQLGGLSVRSIAYCGWEEQDWEVKDAEKDKLSFRCQAVQFYFSNS